MPVTDAMATELPAALKAGLREVLGRFPMVRLALVFGSVAAGTARPDSDLDLAVDAGHALSAAQMLDLTEALAEQTGSPVDLIDLATVSVPLLGQIVRHGQVILGSNEDVAQLMGRYLVQQADFMPLHDRILRERRMAWIGR